MTSYRKTSYTRYSNQTNVDYERFANTYSRKLKGKLSLNTKWDYLDIACGYGNFLSFLKKSGINNFIGVDSSENATKLAAEQFGNDHIINEDIFDYLKSLKTKYMFVSALDFIEHLHKNEIFDFLKLLNEHHRQKGLLLLRTPNASGLFGMAARYNDITHETCFTPTSIRDVLGHCGYKTISIWEDAPTIGNVIQTMHYLSWKVARLLIRCLEFAESGILVDGILTRNMWILSERL